MAHTQHPHPNHNITSLLLDIFYFPPPTLEAVEYDLAGIHWGHHKRRTGYHLQFMPFDTLVLFCVLSFEGILDSSSAGHGEEVLSYFPLLIHLAHTTSGRQTAHFSFCWLAAAATASDADYVIMI